jgi:glycopeptide antibiotics resistance protein
VQNVFVINVGAIAVITFPPFAALLLLWWRRRHSARELVLVTAMYLYVLGVARYTLLPFSGPAMAAEYRAQVSFLGNVNFVPLSGLALGGRGPLLNIVLAIPWGVLVAALWRRRWGTRTTLLMCLAFGPAIELLQLLLGGAGIVRFRSVDVNDALLNALGAVGGYAGFVVGLGRWPDPKCN